MFLSLMTLQGFKKFGFVVHDNGDITYREWAPNAVEASLIGDFSNIPSLRLDRSEKMLML